MMLNQHIARCEEQQQEINSPTFIAILDRLREVFYTVRSINKVSLGFFYSNTESIRDDPYWTSRKNSLELIELSSINKVSLVYVSSCSNTGAIRHDPYWTSRKNSLELIELSSINKVSLV
jgi:hypothetical protein